MLNFSDADHQAKLIAIFYAKQLKNEYVQKFFKAESDIKTAVEAEVVAEFFWRMVDCAVEDEEQSKEIEGAVDLQFWMERLMNILMGYTTRIGLGDIWVKTSNRANKCERF